MGQRLLSRIIATDTRSTAALPLPPRGSGERLAQSVAGQPEESRDPVAFDLERNQSLFSKMDGLLAKTRAHPLPERVHQVRTTARRLEALIETLCPQPRGTEKKLLKRLARLRRRAGKVRDLDVQISALRTLKIGRESERKTHLLESLADDRRRREQRFADALDKESVRKLRNQLRRAASDLFPAGLTDPVAASWADTAPAALDPVPLALARFAVLSRRQRGFTEDNLHPFRTACKRIRYIAEMAGNHDPLARHVVELLKRIQDEAGEWHDWSTLTAAAEKLFASSSSSPLISALRNITRAKFAHALNIVADSRRQLLALSRAVRKPAASLASPPRKSALSAHRATAASEVA